MAITVEIRKKDGRITETEAVPLRIRLLTAAEYKEHKALLPSVKGIWWLNTKGLSRDSMAVVCDDRISPIGLSVRSSAGFRPVVKLETADMEKGDTVEFAGEKWTAISNEEAVSDGIIMNGAFSIHSKNYLAYDFGGSQAERQILKMFMQRGVQIPLTKRWRPAIGPKPVRKQPFPNEE